MSTLYELTNDYLTLLDMAEDPDVEEDVLRDTMEGIEGEIEIKADGYATSSTYVNTLLNCMNLYGLQRYDSAAPEPKAVSYAAIVDASALRVRTGAGTAFPIMQVADHDFLLPRGMVIAVNAELGGWCRVSGLDGWVSGDYLKH